MGLFSTLTGSGETLTSSASLPTIIQLYTSKPLQLDQTTKLSGYSTMTYQALQVAVGGSGSPSKSGGSEETAGVDDGIEWKNRHEAPNLGVWNCQVRTGESQQALVDALLANVTVSVNTYCWTVDLRDAAQVEPTISLLQSALVRHLIENNPTAPPTSVNEDTKDDPKTRTTSLYQLQAHQFGKASEDDKNSTSSTGGASITQNIDEAHENTKTSLMICAILHDDADEVSEEAFQKKQAKALVIYHLRKFAAALDCSLVFVESPPLNAPGSAPEAGSTTKESPPAPAVVNDQGASSAMTQPTVSLPVLSQMWRELAIDQPVWDDARFAGSSDTDKTEGEDPAAATAVATSPIYGPGKQQEDLIETVLLRNAHYPGHWDALKDSLWVALPTPIPESEAAAPPSDGDEGWLQQLRGSVVGDAPVPVAGVAGADGDGKSESPKKKDAEVTDFFASLLKEK